MSSVPEGKRGVGKLRVLTKANELSIYTIKICSNPKVFLPEYQNALTNDIIRTAKDIYMYAWDANEVRVVDGHTWSERRALQSMAIKKCTELLALMQMAQRLFHLTTKRIKYWGSKTIEVQTMLQSWKNADDKRYKEMIF